MIGNDMIIGHQATLKCITGFVEKSRKFFVESKRNDMPEEISVRVFDELVRNALMSTMMPIMASNKIFEPMKFYPIEEYNFSRI
jgi:hypothetical protein